MRTEPGSSAPESATFAHALGELKRNGSTILLVGEDADGAHTTACRRLIGESGSDTQCRLVVTASEPSCTDAPNSTCVGDRPHSNETVVIEHAVREGDGETEDEVRSLGELGMAVIEAINEFDAEADGLEPSELRVCVDSLVPLLEAHSAESVFRVLHMTTSRIRQVNGMGHVHFPLDRNHDAVNLFEPLFDAVVEVRADLDVPKQRWHLRHQETTSEWVDI